MKQQADNLINEVKQYNNNLKRVVEPLVKRRKEELLKQEGMLASLGLPIKKNKDVPETFEVPIQQKKIVIKKQKPVTSSEPFVPEPVISYEDYRAILQACHSLGVSMERLPSTYDGKDEEAIRDLFLLLLSLHFSSATGETFNKKGKTDILIRHEGNNIFVAECKFWGGQKKHFETIDQCLGYLTWRDSKAAIIYFVDRKDIQKVSNIILNETKDHPCFVEFKSKEDASWFNYRFQIPNTEKGVDLAIQFFHFN